MRLFIGIVAFVLLLFISYWVGLNALIGAENRGQFGDQFGGLNALFSGLALAAIVSTLWLQREDLKTQQSMLKAQLVEMKEARSEQAKTARAQAELVEKQQLTAQITAVSTKAQAYMSRSGNQSMGSASAESARRRANYYEEELLALLKKTELMIIPPPPKPDEKIVEAGVF